MGLGRVVFEETPVGGYLMSDDNLVHRKYVDANGERICRTSLLDKVGKTWRRATEEEFAANGCVECQREVHPGRGRA